MPRKRRVTVSDDPSERKLYEEAGKEQETFLILEFKELLEGMPPPPGWAKKRRRKPKRGRPRKRRRGHKEEFGWQGMVLVLLLKALYKLDYRGMSSHLRANPDQVTYLGLARAPSASTIQQAHARMGEAWLKRLNRHLLSPKKRGRDDPRRSRPVWIVLD